MSSNHPEVDELAAEVRADPFNPALRRALVEALIAVGDYSIAGSHFDVLLTLARDQPWLFQLEEQLAIAEGDSVRAARARMRYRDLWATSDEANPPEAQPADEANPAPKLRLLSGGASVDAVRFPTNDLSDVAGLTTVKSLLERIIEEVRNTPENTAGPWVGGALFYGPQGCGKKFCASVIAGELDAEFVVVDFVDSWSPASLQTMLTSLIEANAQQPTVLFLDNLDARFGDDHATAIEPVLNLLDAARTKAPIIIVGSAVTPWQMSTQVATARRLRRVILVLPPDEPARHLFISRYLKQNQVVMSESDVHWVVRQSEGHSFADLQKLLDMAADVGEPVVSHATLRKAIQEVPPSSADWLTHAGHHAMMNEAGGMYDDLLAYFRNRQRH